MSLQAFKEKILGHAHADAQKISQKNADLIADARERALRDIRVLEEGIITAANIEAQQQARSIRQRAELEGRSLVLAAKQEELSATKEAFLESLTELSSKEKQELHNAFAKLIPNIKGEVFLHPDGGLVFRGEGVEINLTLPQIVEQLFRNYRSDIAKELFA